MTELEQTIARIIREVSDPDFAARLIAQLVPRSLGRLGGRPRSDPKGDTNGIQTPSKPLSEASSEALPRDPPPDQDPDQKPPVSSADPELFAETGPVIASMPMTGGRRFDVRESYAAKLRETYPGVDIPYQLRRIVEWLERNPQRKSAAPRGVKARISNWLHEEHEKASRQRPTQSFTGLDPVAALAAREAAKFEGRG